MTQSISLLKALLNCEASQSVPKLSSAQMLDAPENKAIQNIWVLPPGNPRLHAAFAKGPGRRRSHPCDS
jgi:hypothetical protein